MKLVLVTGPGRSCTNWVLETLIASNNFRTCNTTEDRGFLWNNRNFDFNYVAKLATEWYAKEEIIEYVKNNPHLEIVFCLKHPLSLFMSKIYRGQKPSNGGDGDTEQVSSDGTYQGAIDSIKHAADIYKSLDNKISINVESLISATIYEVLFLGASLNISVNEQMIFAYQNNRNKYHQNRYGNKKDFSQIHPFNHLDTAYNKYFSDKVDMINNAKKELKNIITLWNYDKSINYQISIGKINE